MILLLEIQTLEVPRVCVKVDDGRNTHISHHTVAAAVAVGIVVVVRNNESML